VGRARGELGADAESKSCIWSDVDALGDYQEPQGGDTSAGGAGRWDGGEGYGRDGKGGRGGSTHLGEDARVQVVVRLLLLRGGGGGRAQHPLLQLQLVERRCRAWHVVEIGRVHLRVVQGVRAWLA